MRKLGIALVAAITVADLQAGCIGPEAFFLEDGAE
jgi:hypothetical protein